MLLLLSTLLSLEGSSLSALLGDLWATLRLRFPGCRGEEMRETKLSTRPDGNYHPAVQGIIIGLMQYVPSFSDMLTMTISKIALSSFSSLPWMLSLSPLEMPAPFPQL